MSSQRTQPQGYRQGQHRGGNGKSQPQQQQTQQQESGRTPPAHEVRFGRVKATVWANEHPQNGTWFSITLTRSYKDAKSGEWKSASSFGKDDLLAAAEALREAFLWVMAEQAGKPPQENQGGDDIPF